MGRKPNGGGSVYQRSDGRWEAALSIGNGKRNFYLGRTWQEAHEKLVAAQKAQQDGLPAKPERQTVKQFLLHWLETTTDSRKPRTNVRYGELIRNHVLPALGTTQLSRLTPQQLQGLYASLSKKLAPSTVLQVHAILHKALKQAAGWGTIGRNPADYVERPRAPRVETHVLTPEQIRAFLAAATGTRFEALFVLAVTTGMREGELLGLRWRDVDLDNAALHVRHQMQRIDGVFRLVEPKSNKSRRLLALNSLATAALRRHRVKQNQDRLRQGTAWQDLDIVFANEIGKPVEVTNLTQRYFRPLLAKAGLPKIRVHDLRHSAATTMLSANVNVKIVSEMLGHSQTAFTMDRYQHVSLAMQRDAARAMEAALS